MPHTSNPGHLTKHVNTKVYKAFAIDLGKYIENEFSIKEDEANKQWLRDIASTIPDRDSQGKNSGTLYCCR